MSNVPEHDKDSVHSESEAHKPSTVSAAPESQGRPTDAVPESQKQSTDAAPETQKQLSDAVPESQKRSTDAAPEPQKRSISSAADTHTTPAPSDQLAPQPVATTSSSEQVTQSQRPRLFGLKQFGETWVPTLAFVVIVIQSFILLQQSRLMDSQTRLMEKSFRVSERAYVGVDKVTVNMESHEILILLQNIGHIPAAAVTVQGQQIRTTAEKKDPKGTVFRWDAGEVELFPGTEMQVVVSLEPFEQSEVDAIKNRKELLFIGGTIHYNDGFGNSEKTTFAFHYDPPDRWIAHSDLSKMFKEIAR